MASRDSQITKQQITEGLVNNDFWNLFDCRLVSYVKSPIQLYFISSKTSIIGRALRHAVVDLLDHISQKSHEYVENETTVIGTEHRLCHSCRYTVPLVDNVYQYSELNDGLELEISSLAPTVFYQLRESIGISNADFLRSFAQDHLKDFTNPGKSGSLMYKTSDDLFLLKTLREYEARLLMQILSGYHLQLAQRSTILNRYVGLYSIRFPALFSSTEVHVVVMLNAFTSSLQINEIFDLKGSTIKRKSLGNLSKEKLHKLKDLDFLDLYPNGIRIPSNIYRRLYTVISNDAKVLKKLHITDYSLILGIKYVGITEDDLMQTRPTTGVSALFHMTHRLALIHSERLDLFISSSINSSSGISISYLKPLEMIQEKLDSNIFYSNDPIAAVALPIPGIINKSNQRVYIYLAIVDMLQTYDSFKYIEQTLKKLTDPSRHLQYSVIDPDEYEKRIVKFLFEHVFHDAGEDFLWNRTENNEPIANTKHRSEEEHDEITIENECSDLKTILQFRL